MPPSIINFSHCGDPITVAPRHTGPASNIIPPIMEMTFLSNRGGQNVVRLRDWHADVGTFIK